MVEAGTAAQLSKISIQLTEVFTVVGVGLLYLTILISSAPDDMKLLWASALSLTLAVIFLIVWAMARDFMKQRETQKKISP
jgi:hypothetical protein